MNIKEIKEQYEYIKNLDIMKYNLKIMLYKGLIESISNDERKAVRDISKKCEKQIEELENEITRVRKMMLFEEKYKDMPYICGIDEVGRGPLAGPIVTAAVILPKDFVIPYLNDSKQLTPKRREELYDIITENAVTYGIGSRSERYIDSEGIQKADYESMKESVSRLTVKPDVLLIDALRIPDMDIKEVSIIKGDTLSVSIAAASIIAKVTRDRLMTAYDALYPEYGFASNMGYGSSKHLEALKTIGACEIHRKSFLKNIL